MDMIPALVWSFRVYHYIDTHYLNSTRSYVASRIALYPFAPCCSPFCCRFYLRIFGWRMGSGGPHVLTCVDISCPGTFTTQPYNFSCLCAPTVEKIDILQCFLDKNCTSADFAAALSVCVLPLYMPGLIVANYSQNVWWPMLPAVVDESKEGAIIGGVLGGALLVVLSVGCYLFGKHRRIKAITEIEIPDGARLRSTA